MSGALFTHQHSTDVSRKSLAVRSASDKAFGQILRTIEGDRPRSVGREDVFKTIASSLAKQSQDGSEARVQTVNSVLDCLLLHCRGRGSQVLELYGRRWNRTRRHEFRRSFAIEHAYNMTIHELMLLRLEFHESQPDKDSQADVIFTPDDELNLE
jgi:hypothetical protein